MKKIALVIIYNHRFDRNIPILEDLLDSKWSHIFHVVPFYDGDKENVIPVYESSLFYSGYIAQAYTHLKEKGFTHFVFIGDDMVLNPMLDESTIHDKLGLADNESFIPTLECLDNRKWSNTSYALYFTLKNKGAEVSRFLPPYEEAVKIFESKGFCNHTSVSFMTALRNLGHNNIIEIRSFLRCLVRVARHMFHRVPFEYPFVGAVSDFLIIDAETMPLFVHYCGVFAALPLFIEVAVPTSLVLACKNIKTQDSCSLKEGYFWNDDVATFEKQYGCSYYNLIKNFPVNKLFVHPVKLSKWMPKK